MADKSPEPAEQEEQRVEHDLDALLAETARERDEYLELAKRTKADFENYRKRVAGEAKQAEARGRLALAREILTVADNLERALENMTPHTQPERAVGASWSSASRGMT
ncbi:MAG: nucleotide exchange factor GrpE [Solirubrobacterales bacterium]